MEKIKVLIVDDSAFIRSAIQRMLTSSNQIEIVGVATDGKQGVEKALQLLPDVITMDIEMPNLNGIEATKIIMEKCPTNIIMVSTLTEEGATSTLSALENGAVDFITKKNAFNEVNTMKDELISKILEVGGSNSLNNKIRRRININKNLRITKDKPDSHDVTKNLIVDTKKDSVIINNKINLKPQNKIVNIKAICIGISTGGPLSLQKVIPTLPKDFPVPIFIVQHMPPFFTKTLSERLNELSALSVKEAQEGDIIQKGSVYLAPGGKQMRILRNGKISISQSSENDQLFNPSVDIMVNSAIDVYHNSLLGIIMTGMGHDGRDSLKKLHQIGGYVIAQSPDSCVISGMPSAVIDNQSATEIIDLEHLAQRIGSFFINK